MLGHRGELLDPELPTEGRRDARGGDDSPLSAAAAVDRLPLGWCRGAGGRGELIERLVEPALGLQQPHDLAHEQWIALGLGVDRASDRVGDVAPR